MGGGSHSKYQGLFPSKGKVVLLFLRTESGAAAAWDKHTEGLNNSLTSDEALPMIEAGERARKT